jgi:plastocyanin
MTSTTRPAIAVRRAIAAACLCVAAALAPASAQAATPKLVATVGPGFTITLKTAAGAKVTTLKAGTYAITVRDRSRLHDFHLRGPGLNKVLSGVAAVGTRTVKVQLRAGKYRFTCQPHTAAMRGTFSVR